jgi:hypothetical protein
LEFESLGKLRCSGFRVQGAGFKLRGSGFRMQGAGFRLRGSGFRVQGAGFRVVYYHTTTCRNVWDQVTTSATCDLEAGYLRP